MKDIQEEFLKIDKQLKAIKESFEFIKSSGLDREILIAYLKDKSGMGKNDIIGVLEAQDDFFAKLTKLAVRPKD